MTVMNVSKSGQDIKFRIISFQFLYYLFITFGAFAMTSITAAWIFAYRMEFQKIGLI